MAITHTRTVSYKDQSSNTFSLVDAVATGVRENNIDKALIIGTDASLPYTATRANLLALCITSDVDCTIKTNSSGSPTETISIKANQVLAWVLATDGLARCPFSADITALFVTNAAAANVKIRTLLSA